MKQDRPQILYYYVDIFITIKLELYIYFLISLEFNSSLMGNM